MKEVLSKLFLDLGKVTYGAAFLQLLLAGSTDLSIIVFALVSFLFIIIGIIFYKTK